MNDALRFHGEYEALLMEPETDEPYPFPFEISAPIGIFTTSDFTKASDGARTIGRVTAQELVIQPERGLGRWNAST